MNCKLCDIPIIAKRKGTEFCSHRHYQKWRDEQLRPKRFCEVCYTELPKGSHSLWCGEGCECLAHFIEMPVKQCRRCELMLLGKPTTAEFCSRGCYHLTPKTTEMKERVSKAGTGRKQRPETIAKRAAHPNVGKKHSPEVIAKIVASNSWYYDQGHSEETRAKMRAAKARNPMRGPRHWNWRPNREQQRLMETRAKTCHAFIGRTLRYLANGFDDDVTALGYSPRQLAEHLENLFEPGMTWESHGKFGWHIDHIRPIASFPLGTPMSVINSLENLRPMWWSDNLRKGARYEGTDYRTNRPTIGIN